MGIMLSPETLRCYPLFAGLDHCAIKALSMIGEKIAVDKGEWLFYEGGEADALYLILQGRVDLMVALDHKGTRHVDLFTLVDGDLFGWSAVVEPGVYRLSAVSATDVVLARWDGVDLAELMTHHPAMGYKLMCRIVQIVGNRLAEFCVRFASLVEGDQWEHIAGPHSPGMTSSN